MAPAYGDGFEGPRSCSGWVSCGRVPAGAPWAGAAAELVGASRHLGILGDPCVIVDPCVAVLVQVLAE